MIFRKKPNLLLLSLLLLLSSCVAPVNSLMESARTLDKGDFEITPSYGAYSSDGERVNNNYGLRVGYGISDEFDLKLRYIRMIPSIEDDASGVNFFSLEPKYSILPRVLSARMPLSVYFIGQEEGETFVLSPQIIGTYAFSNKVEITFAPKLDIILEEEADTWLGFALGLGLSDNLDNWAVRPEIGLNGPIGEGNSSIFNFGIGFTFAIKN